MENKHLAFRRVRARENLTAQRNKKMGGSSQKQKQKPNLLYFLLILELWCVACARFLPRRGHARATRRACYAGPVGEGRESGMSPCVVWLGLGRFGIGFWVGCCARGIFPPREYFPGPPFIIRTVDQKTNSTPNHPHCRRCF